MKSVIFIALFAPVFAHAGCITDAQQQYAEAAKQLKAKTIFPSQFDLAKLTYINKEYACDLISENTFCSQIPAAYSQLIDQIQKDYPDSDARDSLVSQLLADDASVVEECL